jgi:hypothetical protein
MDARLRRQLHFSMVLQGSAALMLLVAFVLRVIYSGLDVLAVVFLLAGVGAAAFAVVLFKRARQLSSPATDQEPLA